MRGSYTCIIEHMAETIIQIVQGDDTGAMRRAGLTTAQRGGRACLACGETDDVTRHVGWVDGVSVKVHTYHLEHYRLGQRLRPGRHRAR